MSVVCLYSMVIKVRGWEKEGRNSGLEEESILNIYIVINLFSEKNN